MRNATSTCLAVAMIAALAGCSTARVRETAYALPNGTRPVEILVDVSAGDFSNASQASLAQALRANLQADLVQELTAARVFAEPLTAGARREGTAVLHVTITEASRGNAVERLVIGFGAGRSKLQVAAELRPADAGGASPLVAFNTASDSGRKPGLIVPGAIAAGAASAVPLAVGGGVDLALSTRDGLDKPVKATARAVIDQLEKYYASVGWYWPTADQAHHT